MRTAKQWLEVYKAGDLPREAAKVPVERPWEHCLGGGKLGDTCTKCDRVVWPEKGQLENSKCPVPDPIDAEDWNVAMVWFRKMPKTKESVAVLRKLYRIRTGGRARLDYTVVRWLLELADAKDLVIAACMAREKQIT